MSEARLITNDDIIHQELSLNGGSSRIQSYSNPTKSSVVLSSINGNYRNPRSQHENYSTTVYSNGNGAMITTDNSASVVPSVEDGDYDYVQLSSFFDRLSCGSIVYLLPAIVVFGIALNFGAVCLMSRSCQRRKVRRRESSFLNYLLALSTFDIFILLFICPIHLPPAMIMCGSEMSSLDITVYALLLLPFIQTAKYASIWCITNIAVQRYFAICKPFCIQRYRFLRSHNKSIALITLLAFCINIPQFWVITLGPMPNVDENGSLVPGGAMGIVPGPLHVTNNKSYYIANEIMISLLLYIIPLMLLIILTVKTMAYIWRSGRTNFSKNNRNRGRAAEANRTFLTIAIVITFFTCHTLSILLTWLRIAQIFGFQIQLQTERILNDFGNFMIALNSAVNPLLYLFFTRKFKDLIEVRRRYSASAAASSGRKLTNAASSYGGFTLNSVSSMSVYGRNNSSCNDSGPAVVPLPQAGCQLTPSGTRRTLPIRWASTKYRLPVVDGDAIAIENHNESSTYSTNNNNNNINNNNDNNNDCIQNLCESIISTTNEAPNDRRNVCSDGKRTNYFSSTLSSSATSKTDTYETWI